MVVAPDGGHTVFPISPDNGGGGGKRSYPWADSGSIPVVQVEEGGRGGVMVGPRGPACVNSCKLPCENESLSPHGEARNILGEGERFGRVSGDPFLPLPLVMEPNEEGEVGTGGNTSVLGMGYEKEVAEAESGGSNTGLRMLPAPLLPLSIMPVEA